MTIASGSESQVNTTTIGDQTAPKTIALSNGGYAVVWSTATGWSLQRFTASGAAIGGEVALPDPVVPADGTHYSSGNPSDYDYTGPVDFDIIELPNGSLLYAYSVNVGTSSHSNYYLMAYTGVIEDDGTVVRPATWTLFSGGNPSLELGLLPDGDILLLCDSAVFEVGKGTGHLSFQTRVGDWWAVSDVKLVQVPDGRLLFTWYDDDRETVAAYWKSGRDYGGIDVIIELPIPKGASLVHGDGELYFASAAKDQNGVRNIAVGTTDGTSADTVWADAAGTTPSDVELWQLEDGRLLLTWTASTGGDGNGKSVMGQLVAFGLPIGDAFVINSTVAGDQTGVSIVALADGRFVATWQSPGLDGDGLGIATRTFDPRLYTSTSGDDLWIGGKFAETINGGEGDDTLGGDGGDDRVSGGAGDDLLIDTAGKDSIYGGADDDRITVNTGNLVAGRLEIYDGGSDTDTLRVLPPTVASYMADLRSVSLRNFEKLAFADPGMGGTARIQLVASQIWPTFLSGSASVDGGGAGEFDSTEILGISMGAATSVDLSKLVFQNWGAVNDRVEILGDAAAEKITGSVVNDWFGAGAGNDTLIGLGGKDTINGMGGIDRMEGGDGSDIYYADVFNDVIVEANSLVAAGGDDIVNYAGAALTSYTLGANLERLTLSGTLATNGRGNGLANTLTGNSAANILLGLGGNDSINGMGGVDRMDGGDGSDTYTADVFNDVIVETNTVKATGGDDTVLYAGAAGSTFTLSANVERLTLNNTLATNGVGNTLANTLIGNSVANKLNGMLGNDTMTGGTGADHFQFSTTLGATNVDTITIFEINIDEIALSASIFTKAGAAGGLALAAFHAAAGATAGAALDDRIIYNTSNGWLSYDADGNKVGGLGSIHFATLANRPALLDNADFLIV